MFQLGVVKCRINNTSGIRLAWDIHKFSIIPTKTANSWSFTKFIHPRVFLNWLFV